jgi:hypothetical protein
VARMGERRGVYRVLVGKPEGKRPLGWPRRRWEDSIKMDLTEMRIDGTNWIRLPQDRVQWRAFVNTVMNRTLGFIEKAGCCLTSLVTISFSKNILYRWVIYMQI